MSCKIKYNLPNKVNFNLLKNGDFFVLDDVLYQKRTTAYLGRHGDIEINATQMSSGNSLRFDDHYVIPVDVEIIVNQGNVA